MHANAMTRQKSGGLRFRLISFLFLQVKQESLGISTKMFLKVDVESGKLYFKKSKDGAEDKYYVHNKSKRLFFSSVLLYFSATLAMWLCLVMLRRLAAMKFVSSFIHDPQRINYTAGRRSG